MTERQEKLLEFVKEQHGEQKRKYDGSPYWWHVKWVGKKAAKYVYLGFEIGICHDLFEDTPCTYQMLNDKLTELGYEQETEVATILLCTQELTDEYTSEKYPQFNRATRKQMEAERLGKISATAQTVKYADFIHNSKSIAVQDKGFAIVFLKEVRIEMEKMRKGNFDLFMECCQVWRESAEEAKLNPNFPLSKIS